MGEIAFKYARRSDLPIILQFIKELAEYEGLAEKLAVTEESLEDWIFIRNKAEVLFETVDGNVIGFCLFYHNFSACATNWVLHTTGKTGTIGLQLILHILQKANTQAANIFVSVAAGGCFAVPVRWQCRADRSLYWTVRKAVCPAADTFYMI